MCTHCGHIDFLEELEDLLGDSEYEWAEETISGIQETIKERGHVTERQREAIGNIVAAVERRN